jgi:hypothetical protein
MPRLDPVPAARIEGEKAFIANILAEVSNV